MWRIVSGIYNELSHTPIPEFFGRPQLPSETPKDEQLINKLIILIKTGKSNSSKIPNSTSSQVMT